MRLPDAFCGRLESDEFFGDFRVFDEALFVVWREEPLQCKLVDAGGEERPV